MSDPFGCVNDTNGGDNPLVFTQQHAASIVPLSACNHAFLTAACLLSSCSVHCLTGHVSYSRHSHNTLAPKASWPCRAECARLNRS